MTMTTQMTIPLAATQGGSCANIQIGKLTDLAREQRQKGNSHANKESGRHMKLKCLQKRWHESAILRSTAEDFLKENMVLPEHLLQMPKHVVQ